MSKDVKTTLPGIIYKWVVYQAAAENRKVSEFIRHAVIVYLGQRVGKNNLTIPPEMLEK